MSVRTKAKRDGEAPNVVERDESELPEGWCCYKVGDLFSVSSGGTPSRNEPSYWNGDVPWLSSGDIKTDEIDIGSEFITEAALQNSTAKLCEPGSVLVVVRSGVLKHTLPVALLRRRAAINQDMKCFNSGDGDLNRWLAIALRASSRNILAENREGTTVQSVKSETLRDFELPIPPLAEQRRIVGKLELLLGKVSSSQQRLSRIPGLLKRFRQSVLAAACSGKLTADWREENSDVEIATEFLKRIALRRQQEYADAVQTASITGNRKPRKILMDRIPEIDFDSKDVPDTWTRTNIEFAGHVTKLAGFEYTEHIQLRDVGEVAVVRAQNVQMGRFVKENIKFISQEVSQLLERSQLRGREVLMVFIGAGTGNVCMAPTDGKWHLAPNVAKIDVDGLEAEYLCFYLQSPIGFAQTSSWIKATAQPSLSMETIRQIEVNIPPLAEQQEIVRRVEKLLAFADQIEARLMHVQANVDRLTQSILGKAFRGELVPTEHALATTEGRDYESASELLARIQASKTNAEPAKRKRGKASKT